MQINFLPTLTYFHILHNSNLIFWNIVTLICLRESHYAFHPYLSRSPQQAKSLRPSFHQDTDPLAVLCVLQPNPVFHRSLKLSLCTLDLKPSSGALPLSLTSFLKFCSLSCENCSTPEALLPLRLTQKALPPIHDWRWKVSFAFTLIIPVFFQFFS